MKVLVIEDEAPAARRICKLLEQCGTDLAIVGVIESVRAGKQWFADNEEPDLIFSDIQLSDDLSFELFRDLSLNTPVIFTTAYDEYAINAFQHNSIDYLLKPIQVDQLESSIRKYEERQPQAALPDFGALLQSLQKENYRERFLVSAGPHLTPIAASEVLHFFSDEGLTFLTDDSGKKYMLSESLDQLEQALNPRQFFRANRQVILAARSVQKVEPYFNQKLLVKVEHPPEKEVVVSKLKATAFKRWLNQ